MDTLKLLLGKPYRINDYVSVANPKVSEILEFGEKDYFSIITSLTSTAWDHKLMLFDAGIDYVQVDDYQMFQVIYQTFDQEETSIILGDLDIASLIAVKNESTGEIELVDADGNMVFDYTVYEEMVGFIRECNGIKRRFEIPGNEMARQVFIEEDRERLTAKPKGFKSILEPLISTLFAYFGCKPDELLDMSIYTFFNLTKRVTKIEEARNFAMGMYAGNIDVSKMSRAEVNKRLDIFGEL